MKPRFFYFLAWLHVASSDVHFDSDVAMKFQVRLCVEDMLEENLLAFKPKAFLKLLGEPRSHAIQDELVKLFIAKMQNRADWNSLFLENCCKVLSIVFKFKVLDTCLVHGIRLA